MLFNFDLMEIFLDSDLVAIDKLLWDPGFVCSCGTRRAFHLDVKDGKRRNEFL